MYRLGMEKKNCEKDGQTNRKEEKCFSGGYNNEKL